MSENAPFAGLTLADQPKGSGSDSETGDKETGAQTTEEETTMTEEERKAAEDKARQEAAAEATAAANARTQTIMASEHYAGNEKLAMNLMGTSLTAEQVIAALADANKPEQGASEEEIERRAEEKAGEQVGKILDKENGGQSVEANAGGGNGGAAAGKTTPETAAKTWSNAYAKLGMDKPQNQAAA